MTSNPYASEDERETSHLWHSCLRFDVCIYAMVFEDLQWSWCVDLIQLYRPCAVVYCSDDEGMRCTVRAWRCWLWNSVEENGWWSSALCTRHDNFLALPASLDPTVREHPAVPQLFSPNKGPAIEKHSSTINPGTRRDSPNGFFSILLWRSRAYLCFSVLRQPITLPSSHLSLLMHRACKIWVLLLTDVMVKEHCL